MNKNLIINAYIMTMEQSVYENGYILSVDGKISKIGEMTDAPTLSPEEGDTWDAHGGWLLPGLVDAHSHIGLYEDSLGIDGDDANEDTEACMPQLRALDGINPLERAFSEARAAGVTAVLVSPGSANPIGGQIVAMKTAGRRVDDMVIREPAAIKMALGENPKAAYRDREETPVTRMAIAAMIRDQLEKAREYSQRRIEADKDADIDVPEYDAKQAALMPLMSGKIAAHFHAHRLDDIFTALRLAKEFGIRAVIVHGTEAHLAADILAREGVQIISGPFMTDRSKPELTSLTERSPALLAAAGVQVAITCDHPEIPIKYLMNTAMMAVRAGMDEIAALRAITIDAAEIAEIADRVGSLAVGKDADMVLFTDNPFEYKSNVVAVWCDGACVHEGEYYANN